MKILAIGAHPGDIEFGCGGTLYKYRLKGHHVEMLVLTDGARGGDPKIRKKEQEEAANLIGAKSLHWGGFADCEIPCDSKAVMIIEKKIHDIKPDLVFTHYMDDTHQDHRNAALASIAANRKVKNLLFYESFSTSTFSPQVYVDITSLADKKFEFLNTHKSQQNKTYTDGITLSNISRSFTEIRGSEIFVKHAEAFHSARLIINI